MQDRDTFNLVPGLYNEIRPGYPAELLQAIEQYAGLGAASTIVEVGPGTGQASGYFIERGYTLVGVEAGADLAEFAQGKFSGKTNASFVNCALEEWEGDEGAFDLLLAAQSFHWIEPEAGLKKAAALLKAGGAIALMWHLDESQHTEFWRLGTPLHEKYLSGSNAAGKSLKDDRRLYTEALSASSSFEDVQVRECTWQRVYTADEWIKMRGTFSPDLNLAPEVRGRFHAELRGVIEELGGSCTRFYRTVCIMARKKKDEGGKGL